MRFCKIRRRPVIAQGEARIRRAVVDEQLQRNLRIGDDILATVSSTRRGTPRFPRKYTRHMATIDAGRYHKKPSPAENGSVRMQTMSSAQILSSLFYIYVYMRQEIKQWTNRKTYAKMDKKRGMHCETRSACRPPQGNACLLVLFGHVLSGVRTAGIPTPRLFRRRRTVFVELSHRPFYVPLRLCFPHHGRRDGKGQPSALYSVLASASTAAAAASFMPPRSVTVGSIKVRFLLFSSMRCMVFAAVGAHAPFSIKATVRF